MATINLSQLDRLHGWEGRLAAAIEAARHTPYCLGVHDCFRFACTVVDLLVGVDRWPEFAGVYTTQRECLHLLAEHGHNFTEAGNWFFGSQPVSWKLARRGDLLEYRDAKGAHLVVCRGADCAALTDAGLQFVPLDACAHAWRIG